MLKVNSNLKLKITDCLDLLVRFKADESGATGIEYALITSLVGVLGVSSAGFIGENLSGTFEEIGKAFDGDASSCLLYTSPSPRDLSTSRMPSSA